MLAFLFSPIGRWVGGGVLILIVVSAIYFKGRADGVSGCEARVQAAIVAEQARRRAVADKAVGEALKRQRDAEEESAELERKLDDYERELATRPEPRCALSPRDVEGLQ